MLVECGGCGWNSDQNLVLFLFLAVFTLNEGNCTCPSTLKLLQRNEAEDSKSCQESWIGNRL